MDLNSNEKRQLRNLFENPAWSVIGKVLKEYRQVHFFEESAKRETEFDTMWWVAHREGGKEHLDGFIQHLTDEADDR